MNLTRKLFLLLLLILLFLTFLANNIQPKIIKDTNKLSYKNTDEKISLQGKIHEIKTYPEVTYLKLENQNITIVIFTKTPINLNKNQTIKIEGKVSYNKNELQLIADKIQIKIQN